eukprot:2305960-Pyramimonas_sp.AAC.1
MQQVELEATRLELAKEPVQPCRGSHAPLGGDVGLGLCKSFAAGVLEQVLKKHCFQGELLGDIADEEELLQLV